MRALALLPLLSLPTTWAVPASELQTILNEIGDLAEFSGVNDLFGDITKGVGQVAKQADKLFHDGQEKVEKWAEEGKEFVKQNGLTCVLFQLFISWR